MKKYQSGVDGRQHQLEPEFNEAARTPIESPAVPATDLPKRRGKAGPGRTAGLTPRIQEIICAVIAAGNYQKVAAQAAGISEETLIKWRQRGRRGTEPYASLEKAIEQADRDCETALVANSIDQMERNSANFQPPVLMAPDYPAFHPPPAFQPSEVPIFQQPVSPFARPLENGPLF